MLCRIEISSLDLSMRTTSTNKQLSLSSSSSSVNDLNEVEISVSIPSTNNNNNEQLQIKGSIENMKLNESQKIMMPLKRVVTKSSLSNSSSISISSVPVTNAINAPVNTLDSTNSIASFHQNENHSTIQQNNNTKSLFPKSSLNCSLCNEKSSGLMVKYFFNQFYCLIHN